MATIKGKKRVAHRANIVKAEVYGSNNTGNSLAFLTMGEESLPTGTMPPPYDFQKLYTVFEFSSILRPCVDAYVTNIESFGHHFVPAISFDDSAEARTRMADALLYEQMLEVHDTARTIDEAHEPEPEEVEQRMQQLRKVARLEYARLKAFFSFVCPTFSFTELRRRTRQDLEITGNAFWEVVRNALGEIAHFYYVNPIPMRLCAQDDVPFTVEEKVRVSDITWRTFPVPRLFRRYVKLMSKGKPIYFKEFGDPRTVSRLTGKVYNSVDDMRRVEPEADEATEIVHFAIPTPNSAYGVPRWIANLPAVLGSRELDEVNLNYFKNNVVPPLALLCSGGRFGKGVATRIEEFIDEHLKGKKGINRILVLEAEGQKVSGEPGPKTIPKVQFVPLRDVQQTDGLFQNYDTRNEEKLAKSFRLPRILRGDDKQLNKATAFASLKFAEEEVFEPEREQFDSFINRRIFPTMNITFWHFRSNSPIVRDPEVMVTMVSELVKFGVLTVNEARQICADIFNRAFTDIAEEWTNKPLPFILAQLRSGDMTAFLKPNETGGNGASNTAGSPTTDSEWTNPPRLPVGAPTGAGTPLRPLGAGDEGNS